ncbi:MAG: transcriptional regulator [Rhodospirillaceae bacterium]|jgi:putative transcriptional regulator|nr:transcriptional regulator [Rhodospirillaceae bacterium]MDP6624659.1 transcriptional regulator [Alphaproteobacteria bacterium]|tara:strand:+ start:577 stop:927 length:351 start_codon:yes stop_codon:yes gene_type:complete
MSEYGESILRGARDALAIAEGRKKAPRTTFVHVPPDPDIKEIRVSTGMTQLEFAGFFGFKLSALQAWEQGRRKPHRTARILFRVIQYDPVVVHKALRLPIEKPVRATSGKTQVAAE